MSLTVIKIIFVWRISVSIMIFIQLQKSLGSIRIYKSHQNKIIGDRSKLGIYQFFAYTYYKISSKLMHAEVMLQALLL